MAFSLPQFILLKSNKKDKYLRYRKEDDSNHAFLQFSGDEKEENVEIQYVKFEVQNSKTLEGFVHIRSCYNHKYWVRKSGGDESRKSWIAVEANEPEEDPSKLSCTLFKPVLVDDGEVEKDGEVEEDDKPQKIRLVHVDQVGQQGCVAPANSNLLTLQVSQLLDGGDDEEGDVFTAYNATSTILLPESVVFTDHQGRYNGRVEIRDSQGLITPYVAFSASDIGRALLIQPNQYPLANPPYIECRYLTPNGNWSRASFTAPDFIEVQAAATPLRLRPVRLPENKLGFNVHTVGQYQFVNRASALGNSNLLGYSIMGIPASANFGVEEPVLFRVIRDVKYNLEDSRVYNMGSVDKFRDERWNMSSLEQTGTFSVAYTRSRTMSWGDSLSLTKSISASMSASIPFVGISFGVELSQESNQTVEFGREETEEETVEFEQSLAIPPGKKITLLVVATRAQCDVPFTCRVTDTLSNGTVRTYTKTDGLFGGGNEFSFHTEILEEDI